MVQASPLQSVHLPLRACVMAGLVSSCSPSIHHAPSPSGRPESKAESLITDVSPRDGRSYIAVEWNVHDTEHLRFEIYDCDPTGLCYSYVTLDCTVSPCSVMTWGGHEMAGLAVVNVTDRPDGHHFEYIDRTAGSWGKGYFPYLIQKD